MTAPTPDPSRGVDREALREEVAAELSAHAIECTGLGEVTCRCREGGWMPWSVHRRHVTDAILPILDRLTADADRAGYERGRREALEAVRSVAITPSPEWDPIDVDIYNGAVQASARAIESRP